MKRFKFSLEQLLKYRSDRAESAKLALAGKIGSINVLKNEIIMSTEQERENFIASRENFSVDSLRQSEYFSSFQEAKRLKASKQIRRLEVERETLLKLYQERLKDELTLNHLKERAYQKYKREQQRLEQIRLDDMINSLVHADNKDEEVGSGEKDGRIW